MNAIIQHERINNGNILNNMQFSQTSGMGGRKS